jgi:hypothetical protein
MYFTIPEGKLNKILEEKNTTLIEYYKEMYSQVDVIADTEDVLFIVPQTPEACQFFDGGTKWCTTVEKTFNNYLKLACLLRFHFKKLNTSIKMTKHFKSSYGQFSDKKCRYYSDNDLMSKYPKESEILKEYLPVIDKYFKQKAEEWFKSDYAHGIHNLHLNYSLEKENYRLRIAKRMSKYVNLTKDTIKGLSMMMYCNTSENFNKTLELASQVDEIKIIEVMMIVSNYNDRFSGYTKEDLESDLKNFNEKYSKESKKEKVRKESI